MMAARVGMWSISEDGPRRVGRSRVGLEGDLESWCAVDPSLLSEGLQVVGRQLQLEAGVLDLLCLDVQGRWVLVELKRDRLRREVLAQALDYVACLQDLSSGELVRLIESGLDRLSDPGPVMDLVDQQLAAETSGDRVIAIVVAGTGVDPGLERVVGYMSRFEIPISVVSFQVFTNPQGGLLLVREVFDEEGAQPLRGVERHSVEDIAARCGTPETRQAFDAIVQAAEEANLPLRAHKRTLTITPPTARNRFLMALPPYPGEDLAISHAPEAFAEFFPGLTAEDVEAVLGEGGTTRYRGRELAERVGLVKSFLSELPEPIEQDDDGRPKADSATLKKVAALVRPGEWTTYGDLSQVVTGRSTAAMAIGNMAASDDDFPNPHRVLNAKGAVSPGWRAPNGSGPEECVGRLEAEGIEFGSDGIADPSKRVAVETLKARWVEALR